jgi:hypothetical protein
MCLLRLSTFLRGPNCPEIDPAKNLADGFTVYSAFESAAVARSGVFPNSATGSRLEQPLSARTRPATAQRTRLRVKQNRIMNWGDCYGVDESCSRNRVNPFSLIASSPLHSVMRHASARNPAVDHFRRPNQLRMLVVPKLLQFLCGSTDQNFETASRSLP